MKQKIERVFNQLFERFPELEGNRSSIEEAFEIIKKCYSQGGKLLICGNGGSSSDSEHIVGELMKSFILKRKISKEHGDALKTAFPENGQYLSENLSGALPAISLVSQSALSFAVINDVSADLVFAQQVYGYARGGDVLIGLSTSGNSQNVVNAVKVAKVLGMKSIGMTGKKGGALGSLCDVVIKVQEEETYRIQEYHLPIYHILCAMIEAEFFEM
jgi:phosphoheptose isomerase